MICSSCTENKLLLSVEQLVINKRPNDNILEEIFDNYISVASNQMKCANCGGKIVEGETYFDDDDDIFNKLTTYISEQIEKRIECCDECETGDLINNIRHSAEKTFTDEEDGLDDLKEQIDTSSTIEDLVYEELDEWFDLWDSSIGMDNIAENISCPNCGNGSGVDYDDKIDYGTFDRYSEVYTHNDVEYFNYNFYGDEFQGTNFISEMAKEFTFDELIDLRKLYAVDVVAATANPLMKRFNDLISTLFANNCIYILSNNRIIFRARNNKIGNIYSPEKMWEPPLGVASHGRYNQQGIGFLYCANNGDVTKKEIQIKSNEQYNIAKLKVKKNFSLFPVNYVFGVSYDKLVSEEVPVAQQNLQVKEQYILTNLLSEVCKKIGYDGIVYCSTKDKLSVDYALFNKYQRNVDLEILEVEV